MRVDEVRALSDDALRQELGKAHEELLKLRIRLATKQLSNVSEVRKTRKTIARIKTVLRERGLEGA